MDNKKFCPREVMPPPRRTDLLGILIEYLIDLEAYSQVIMRFSVNSKFMFLFLIVNESEIYVCGSKMLVLN